METLQWKEIGGEGACRATSGLLCGARAFPIHRHDFPEVFWVTQGAGTHWINSEERPLRAGVLVMIRPEDAHGFRSDARGVLVHNIALSPDVLVFVKNRHFRNDDTFWNGCNRPVPIHYALAADQLRRLGTAFEQLSFGPTDRFQAERFLLNFLHLIHFEPRSALARQEADHPNLPDWLSHALSRWRGNPEHFITGTSALARLAGHSPEHVSRVLRECTGRTPTEWLNETRMSYAAKQLEVTNRKVLDIALECGFGSLGHFYTVFQQAHGCAPRAYRMRFQPRPI